MAGIHTQTALFWAVVTGVVAALTTAPSLSWPVVLGPAVAVWLVVLLVPVAAAWPVGLLGVVGTTAAVVALRLGVPTGEVLALTGLEVVVLIGTATAVRSVPAQGARLPQLGFPVAVTLLLASIAVRHAAPPLTAGYLAWRTGSVDLGVATVQLGELTRLAVVAALVAGLLATTRGWRRLALWALAAAYVAPLLFADQGPAALTLLGCAVAASLTAVGTRPSAALRRIRWAAASTVGLLLLLLAVPATRDRAQDRFAVLLDPPDGTQIGMAHYWLRRAGLFADPGSYPGGYIPADRHDLVVAATGAALGILPMVLVVGAVLAGLLVLHLSIAQAPGVRAIVARAWLVLAVAQAAWAALGALGVVVVTGISMPVLALTGSSVLQTALVVGLAAGATAGARAELAPHSDASTLLVRTGAPVVCLTVAATGLTLVLSPATPTLAASYRLPRGSLLTSDGLPLSDSTGHEREPRPGFAIAGQYSRSTRTASGLERTMSIVLTCGGRTSLAERLAVALRPLPCHPADVLTSIDSTLQAAATSAVDGLEASVTVLDAEDGRVRAHASTFAEHTAEGAPGSTLKMLTLAAALIERIDTDDAPLEALDAGGESLRNIGGMRCPDPSVETALALSCNTVTGYAALRVGQAGLARIGRDYFGSGSPLGFEAPDTSALDLDLGLDAPLLPPELARAAIGQQDVRATTLGMATVAEVLVASADGWRARQPRVTVGSCSNGRLEVLDVAAPIAQQVLDPGLAEDLLGAMRRGATEGSAARLDPHGRSLATKTGTADQQVTGEDGSTEFHTRSWLVAVVDSRWVVAAQVYLPYSTHENAAVPVVQQVMDAIGPQLETSYSCPR